MENRFQDSFRFEIENPYPKSVYGGMKFGKKLHNVIRGRRLSQEKVGDLMDISQAQVSKWCRDKNMPDIEQAIELASILEVTLDYLFNENDQRTLSQFEMERDARKVIERIGWEEAYARLVGAQRQLSPGDVSIDVIRGLSNVPTVRTPISLHPGHIVVLREIPDRSGWTDPVLDSSRLAGPLLPAGWRSSYARLGPAADVPGQLHALPPGATHLVLHAGTPGALALRSALERPLSVAAAVAAFGLLVDVGGRWVRDYRALLRPVASTGLHLGLATLAYPRFARKGYQAAGCVVVDHLDAAILRAAEEGGLPVIESRLVLTAEEDYQEEVEASPVGREKFARAIVEMVTTHDFSRKGTVVYPRPG